MSAFALVASPYSASPAVELASQVWRKRVLPVGEVAYKGRTLRFTRDYLNELASAFADSAYDQVPFQIADARNSHTNDPERYRGQVTGMEVADDGLYVTVATTEAGSRLLATNPRLGISARIVEGYDRADGRHYTAAMQHVLGTLDPRIPALGDWQPVDFSNGYGDSPEHLIDLSNLTFAGEDAPQPGSDPHDALDDEHAALASSMRKLARRLERQHPALGAHQHVDDAANALETGLHDGAVRHLNAAVATMTPQSLNRHGLTTDDVHHAAKRSMDDIHRHVLRVKDLRDAFRQAPPAPAAQLANDYEGGYVTECAAPGDFLGDALAQAAEVAAVRAYEDSQPLARRSEDRLHTVLGRIGRGTYTPTAAERALGFASDAPALDDGGAALACTCGAGISPNHLAGCRSVCTPDEAAELAAQGLYGATAGRPVADARGRVYADQYGREMTMTGHIEALTGQRLRRGSAFEDGLPRREVTAPQRERVYADPDDPDAAPVGFGSRTRQAAALAARHAGIAVAGAAEKRASYAARQGDAIALGVLTRRSRAPHPDFGESTRERAARLKSGADPVRFGGDLLPGELPAYTWASSR